MKIADITVEYVDNMGSDLSIVNAARVSFAKRRSTIEERDKKLMKYLAENDHWSPFAHTAVTIRVKAPLFLARQLVKHQVGLSWNEESRRYIADEPEFYIPQTLHTTPDGSIKQGSGMVLPQWGYSRVAKQIRESTERSLALYTELVEQGIAPEEARMVLPLNTMTNWVWTGSLMAFARVFKQRSDSHAQLAAQEFANKLSPIMAELYPIAWSVLTGEENS